MRFPSFFAYLLVVKTASQAISTVDLFGLEDIRIDNDRLPTCCHDPPKMDQPPRVAKRRIFPYVLERLPPYTRMLARDGSTSDEGKTIP